MEKSSESILYEIMSEYGTQIFRLVYSYVKNRETAEDLTQEVFIKVHRNIGNFKGKSNLKTWLYQIAINTCKDYLGSWHHRYITLTNKVNILSKSHRDQPEKNLLESETSNYIANGIMSLPPKYREVIILYYYEGLNFREISTVLNVNENTLKSRMRRAKKLLKNKFEEVQNYEGIRES